MQLTQVQIKQFRCFSDATFDFDSRVVLIHGENGVGKSSLLEALHYLCYLRSFRTHLPQELIQFGKDNFFVKAEFVSGTQPMTHQLQVGFAQKKRSVKLDQRAVNSFKELMDHYRVVTLTEDDLGLIKGGPDLRRQFIDQAILLENQAYALQVKAFRKVLANRNSLLQQGRCSQESYRLWTEQLHEHSRTLQQQRIALLEQFEKEINRILADIFEEDLMVTLSYSARNDDLEHSSADFIDKRASGLQINEMRYGRSLFGAHLDDIIVGFQKKRSKNYASRGQQKLIVLLLKVAQVLALGPKRGHATLLLDDFMTDFDGRRATLLAQFLTSLERQLIFTSPARGPFFDHLVGSLGAKQIELTD